jgi:hypothetical protein
MLAMPGSFRYMSSSSDSALISNIQSNGKTPKVVSMPNYLMMKFSALFAFFVCSAIFSNAQFEIGQRVLGGNISFSDLKTENANGNQGTIDFTNVFINPSLGWFTKPNRLIKKWL